MKVIECDFPAGSLMDRRMVDTAYYRDSYRAPLCNPQSASQRNRYFPRYICTSPSLDAGAVHDPQACRRALGAPC